MFCATKWLNIGGCPRPLDRLSLVHGGGGGGDLGTRAGVHLIGSVRLMWGLLNTGLTLFERCVNRNGSVDC